MMSWFEGLTADFLFIYFFFLPEKHFLPANELSVVGNFFHVRNNKMLECQFTHQL